VLKLRTSCIYMEKVETAVLITYIVEMMREKDISVVIPTHKYH